MSRWLIMEQICENVTTFGYAYFFTLEYFSCSSLLHSIIISGIFCALRGPANEYPTHHQFKGIANARGTRSGGNSDAAEVVHDRILRVIAVHDVFKNSLRSDQLNIFVFADKEVLDTIVMSYAAKAHWFSLISKRRVRRLVFGGTRGMLKVMTREIEVSKLCIS